MRHPVTRGLNGLDANDGEPSWGRWFRIVGARPTSGMTVMSGPDDKPLLVLSRVDKGRVGLLLSDQMWLWARGYDGGGPYLDLLRRLAHWLMKEPDLEEEALRASAKGREVTVERQSVSGEARETDLVAPDGTKTKLELTPFTPGLSRAHVTVDRFGLYRAEDGEHVALVNVGQEIRSRCRMLFRQPKSCVRSPRRPAAPCVASQPGRATRSSCRASSA